MASLSNHKDGRRTIYTSGPGRPKIALGRIPKKQAESILRHVETLEASKIDGSAPQKATAEWLAGVTGKLRRRLVTLGLAADAIEKPICFSFDEAAESVIRHKHHWSESTRKGFGLGIKKAKLYFGARCDLLAITAADAKDYAAWLVLDDKKADATAGLYLKAMSFCFDVAIDRELTERNPMARVQKKNAVGKKHHLTIEETQAVLRELPWEMHTTFALARWGGLRTPSEQRHVEWEGVDWDRRRLTFWSPKSKEYRMIPIFPELMPFIQQAWDDAIEGERLVCPRIRQSEGAPSSALKRAAIRAGIKPWPRLWHSLRSTRETELLATYPAHVVASWIGHTIQVQQTAYATVTDADFERAVTEGNATETAQIEAQRLPETACDESQ